MEIRCSYKNTHFASKRRPVRSLVHSHVASFASFAFTAAVLLCAHRIHAPRTCVIAARVGFYDHTTCLDGQECNEILIGFVQWLIVLRLAFMRRQKLLKFSLQTSIASSADDR